MKNILKINPKLVRFQHASFSVSANELLQNSFAEFRTKYSKGAKEFREKMFQFLMQGRIASAKQVPGRQACEQGLPASFSF